MKVSFSSNSEPDQDGEAQRRAVGTKLSALHQKVARARTLVFRAEELLDDLENELQDIIRRHFPDSPSRESRSFVTRQVRAEICEGVASVMMVRRTDGFASLHINGRADGILLSPSLAVLLDLLKADQSGSPDGWVGWKSAESLQSQLKERAKHYHSKSAIKQLVYRLRLLLESHGENPSLVQSHRRFGYRFAVRRSTGTTGKVANE